VLASNSAGQVSSASARIRLNKAVGVLAGKPGGPGLRDGIGDQARFNDPTAIVVEPDGAWVVLDASRLRRLAADGTVSTITVFSNSSPSLLAMLPGGDWAVLTNFITNLPGGSISATFTKLERVSRLDGKVTTIIDAAGFSAATGSSSVRAMSGLGVDARGNIYLSMPYAVYRLDALGNVSTLAGSASEAGFSDGPGASARFTGITGMTVDGAGNAFLSDGGNHTVRKIDTNGQVSTLAGQASIAGSADGTGAEARFNGPTALTLDTDSSLLVIDGGNFTIRRVRANGQVSTLAGTALQQGDTDGPRDLARLQRPRAIAASATGDIALIDFYRARAVGTDGSIRALAGLSSGEGDVDGVGDNARFRGPLGLAINSQGTIAVAQPNLLRRVTADGLVGLLAGNRSPGGLTADGPPGIGTFNYMRDVTAGPEGTWYVADNRSVRKVAADGGLTTIIANGFDSANGLAYASGDSLLVTDLGARTVSRVTSAGIKTLVAGQPGVSSSQDGPGMTATFAAPVGIAVDSGGIAYVADFHTIRKIDTSGTVSTIAGLPSRAESIDGDRTTAGFFRAQRIAVDAAGQLLVTDNEDRVRLVRPDGTVSTIYLGVAVNGVTVVAPGRALVADENALILVAY